MNKHRIILIIGIAGIAGAVVTGISDMILLGRPVSALLFFKLGTESMAEIENWRITAGVFIGVITLPFQLLGLSSVFYGIRKNALKVSGIIMLAVFAHALFLSVAFHMGYAFIASGWKLYYQLGASNPIAAEIRDRFDTYWVILLAIMFTEILIGSVIFIFKIMRNKSLYPKWMALFNPISVFGIIFLLIILIPAPLGGFIAPAYLNLSMLAFISLSTFIIYNRLKSDIILS
ncbi:MAG: DUF6796 family protein [Saccharofermentanales bacterium]